MFLGEATLFKWFCLPSEKWSPIGRNSFLLQQTLFHKGISNWCAEKQTVKYKYKTWWKIHQV